MSDQVLVAVVTVLGTIIIAIMDRTRRHARATRAQVENNHSTNMREEGDTRHAQLLGELTGVKSDLRGLRRDQSRSLDMIIKHEERLDDLEQTHPKETR